MAVRHVLLACPTGEGPGTCIQKEVASEKPCLGKRYTAWTGECLGNLVVWIQHFHYCVLGSIPGQGTEIS